jgi:hypothetical protein
MIDPRPPEGQTGSSAPPSRASFFACARVMFEPGAFAFLHNDPIDEGAAMLRLAIYGPRAAFAAELDELVEWAATLTWFSARRAGFERAACIELVEGLAGSTRRQLAGKAV